MSNICSKILDSFSSKKGQIAVLIDPEKTNSSEQLKRLVKKSHLAGASYFFVGGSTVTRDQFQSVTRVLKKISKIPIVIFPGSNHQLSKDADGILFLSLLSGRNPEYLIGQHIESAEEVLHLGIEVLPTSYILVDGGRKSSVAYVSQTSPIPSNQHGIAVKTAVAGHLQGKKITYFDAGSGAIESVPPQIISTLNNQIQTVSIVGGGIRSINDIVELEKAGTNVIVIGNKIEEDIDFLLDIKNHLNKSKSQKQPN